MNNICFNNMICSQYFLFIFLIFQGLFNISDKLLLSLDILVELRESFKRGVPLTVAIESKLAVLLLKTKQVPVSCMFLH